MRLNYNNIIKIIIMNNKLILDDEEFDYLISFLLHN